MWPLTMEDVLAARERIRARLPPTPLRRYGPLDEAVGYGIRVYVKHENHQPTQAFKVRNALAALSALTDEEKKRGVVGASRGNHGQALAWAGQILGVAVTICVPRGNNPEKNEAMRGFGAELIEQGDDYDAAAEVAEKLVRERGLTLVHSTNHRQIIAGAATMTLEILEQEPGLDALVLAVGGGSQAVGAMTATRAMRPSLAVFGVQADRAAAIHDSWHKGKPVTGYTAKTSDEQLKKQLVSRPTTYLLGQVDTLPLGGFDSSCPAMAQGATRRARGEAFVKYVNEQLGAKHGIQIVPECGHNDRCVFTTDAVLPLIFPK